METNNNHNNVHSSENIKVYLRMRPLNAREMTEENAITAWRIVDQHSITLDQSIFNT